MNATTVDLVRSGNLCFPAAPPRPGAPSTSGTSTSREPDAHGPGHRQLHDLYVGGTLTVTNTTDNSPRDRHVRDAPRERHGQQQRDWQSEHQLVPDVLRRAVQRDNTSTTRLLRPPALRPVYCVEPSASTATSDRTAAHRRCTRGGNISFTGYSSGIKTHRYSLVYANATSSTTTLSGNVQLYSSETTLNGNFTISGAHQRARSRTGSGTCTFWRGRSRRRPRATSTGAATPRSRRGTGSMPDEPPQADVDGRVLVAQRDLRRRVRTTSGCPATPATSVVFNSTGCVDHDLPAPVHHGEEHLERRHHLRLEGRADGLLLHVRQQRHLPAGVRVPAARERTSASW